MWHSFASIKHLQLTLLILLMYVSGFSQNDSIHQTQVYDSAKASHDSVTNKLFNYVKKFGDSEQRKRSVAYAEDTIATRQDETIELIKKLTLEAQSYLESGIDTTGLASELNKIERWYKITSDGVFTNTGTIQTHRNLETSYKIMRELSTRMTARKLSLDDYYKNLVQFRNAIDSLYKENILYKFSSDSIVLRRYVEKLTVVSQEIKPIDSAVKKTLLNITELQPVVNRLVSRLSSGIEQIEVFQQDLSLKTFNRETSNLGAPAKYVRRFNEIINFSLIKEGLSLLFYVRNEKNRVFLLALFVVACLIFLVKLKKDLKKQAIVKEEDKGQIVLKYPILSALIIVLNISQFVFVDPPFVFTAIIWMLSAISLTILLKHILSGYWMLIWVALFAFFLLACFDNLILQASRPERWIMFCLSVAGIISGSFILLTGKTDELKGKLVMYFIGFVVIMQIASVLTNAYGRYNLSKTCLTAGFFNVILAVLFFWTLRLMNQVLALTAEMYSRPGKKLFNINFERVGNKVPSVFYILLFLGWFVLFARNFYAYKLISEPVKNFIIQKRTIGEFSFSIGNLLQFFLILYLSGMISRMVSFFASGKTGEPNATTHKTGIGSWLLIIRIAIISIGVLIAFAAIGIPMDRLTIILSALSVGVGFGLQTLVNNLVSGLIISFEKPLSVGDIVEIGGQSGTVKSIGFRSSIIATIAGADVVVPNGDLLNHHLINWTHENTFRRVDIPVGVAYGTNLEQALRILKEMPAKDERVLASPPPNVIITQFNNSSIDMQLSFWVRNIREWLAVKTDLILEIERAFKEYSIRIPLPQQELYIHSLSKKENETKDGVGEIPFNDQADRFK